MSASSPPLSLIIITPFAMQNCFIYCRVSTEEQADKGLSLDTQEKLCREFSERNDYRVSGIYRDEGKSASIATNTKQSLGWQDCTRIEANKTRVHQLRALEELT